ncbi:uncharacterized protein LOC116345041 [Contarinia nasturtii]|uniref:uncharacterized protein LOC116345041 n=1 Tax=Contarinia nasturtii TaxID=265458 RepID=UPI0012D38130|nr:uncharacterized protein LOC116345041 [Contarinia nasturtii]XP_031629931.1 uncharacterized protein LOC116345041 [Contarinia nasturtii]
MSFEVLRHLTCIGLVLAIHLQFVHSQENAQTRIPNSLAECYENAEIYERDNRLPATIDTLIELIRKIEDSPDYTQDIRQVSVALLHRFRMDGIKRASRNYHPSVLPFSPSEYQFSKHRLLLSRLIPGNAQNFPNNTLSVVERCTLHFLLSSSIETQVRGDESTRCGQLAQFRSSRIFESYELSRRKRYSSIPRSNYLCDIEMTDENDQGRCRRQSYRRQHRIKTTTQKVYENDDGDEGDYEDDYGEHETPFDEKPSIRDLIDVASNAISQCPVENGVVRTTWGAVAAGPLIAGIAAGMVQQNVATRELLLLTRNYAHRHRHQQQIQLSVDNRWAATLSGDLSEVTLLQAPIASRRDISVGASGAWNSTTVPHWYFLTQRERLEMTDAEIRGGIDGLVLGLHIAEWRRQTSQLKLSQLLDMYYSMRGVFSSSFRSCNRRELFKNYVQRNQLQSQTIAFSSVLDPEMQLEVTLSNESIKSFSTSSTEALISYVEKGLNDVVCDASSALNPTPETKTASDIHIFIDFNWQFVEVQPAIAALLTNLDVNRFGTRFTLYNANDGSAIINTTNSLTSFFELWNQTSHQTQPTGLNLAAIIKELRSIGKTILNEENSLSKAGGRSFVALIVPQLSPVNEGDSNYVVEQLVNLREVLPDLTLLFWAGGAPGRFARYVVDQQRDLFQLMAFSSSGGDSSAQIYSYTLPVIQRIQSVPRKVANPRCTTDGWTWSQNDWGTNALDQYVEPSGVNFYRLLPNYFYQSGGVVRVQSRYQSQIIVCTSRYQEHPRFSNSSQPNENVDCKQLPSNDHYDYYLSNACDGHYLIQTCPPLYISVQAAPTSQNSYQCTEEGCRYPDEIKYSISLENLGCYSSTSKVLCNLFVMLFSISIPILIPKFKLLF